MTYRDAICAVHAMTYDEVCAVQKATHDPVLHRFAQMRLKHSRDWCGVRDACLGYTPPPKSKVTGGNNKGKQYRPLTTYAALQVRMQTKAD